MANYKEIVTKAVVGKAKKISHNDYSLKTEEVPNTVLGCWVINHTFNGQNNNGSVLLNGSFDINVWYSYDNDTKTSVSTQRFNYSDQMNVRLKDNANLTNSSEIIVRSLKQPTVTDVKIVDGLVNLNVEKELGVEIVGDTKLKVSVEEDEDEYEVIEEYVADNVVDDNIDDINENFLD